MKKILSFLLALMLLAGLCVFPASAEEDLSVKRVVAVSATQLVIEFSQPVAFNMNGQSRGPWICLRPVEKNGGSLWGRGPREDKCIQFIGSYEFLDEKFDRVLWTIELGSCYDNPSIESIVNHEGDMKEWEAYPVKLYLQEVPFDENDPGSAEIDNITTRDGKTYLPSNVPIERWATSIYDIEFDYNYDLGAKALTPGATKLVLGGNAGGSASAALPYLIGGAAGLLIGAVVAVLILGSRKKKARKEG